MNKIKYITFGLALVFGLNFVDAAWSDPTAGAPQSNISAPIHTGNDQVKEGDLTVKGMLVTENAQFDQEVFISGTLQGADASDSTILFGGEDPNSGDNYSVSVHASGALEAKRLQSDMLENTDDNIPICADQNGALVLCDTYDILNPVDL